MKRVLTVLCLLVPVCLVAAPPHLPSDSMYRQGHGIRELPHFRQAGGAAVTTDDWEIVLSPGTYTGTATVILTVAADGTVTVLVDSAKPIYLGDKPTTPEDPDPPEEDPEFAAAVKAIPTPASDRKEVAKLYRDAAPLTSSTRQLKAITNVMFSRIVQHTSKPSEWTAWKEQLDRVVADAGINSHAEYVAAWKTIAEVLDEL